MQLGFLWGLTLHIATNAILLLPFIISLSLAFPSINIHKNEYNLTIEKKGLKSIQNKNQKFNSNLILIENYSFKKCLSLLLDKSEENIRFNESYISGGIPLLKASILLNIKYEINNSNVKFKKEISKSKKDILLELQKAYKFKLIYNTIDYDKQGQIDFKKFCLLNTDKSQNVFKQIEEVKKVKQILKERAETTILKERHDFLIKENLKKHD